MYFLNLIMLLSAFVGLLAPAVALPAPGKRIETGGAFFNDAFVKRSLSSFSTAVSHLLRRWYQSDDTYKAINDISGLAIVNNTCKFPIYVYSCGQGHDNVPPGCSSEESIINPGDVYMEDYMTFVNRGQSLKVGKVPGIVSKPILQLEYTRTPEGRVSYDISAINGNPFGQHGYTLYTSDDSCFSSHCPPPGTNCKNIYTTPDNGIPRQCSMSEDITLATCG